MTKNVDFALEMYYYDHFLDDFMYLSTLWTGIYIWTRD